VEPREEEEEEEEENISHSSYTMDGGGFPGIKRPESESGHSPPCTAEVKKAWNLKAK
jgi:hypothetical protein